MSSHPFPGSLAQPLLGSVPWECAHGDGSKPLLPKLGLMISRGVQCVGGFPSFQRASGLSSPDPLFPPPTLRWNPAQILGLDSTQHVWGLHVAPGRLCAVSSA